MPEASKSPGRPDPRAILQCKQTKNPPREVSGKEGSCSAEDALELAAEVEADGVGQG